MYALYEWEFDAVSRDGLGAIPDVSVVARELSQRVGLEAHIDDDSIVSLDCGGPVRFERHHSSLHCYTFRNPYLLLHLDQVLQALGGRQGGRFDGVPIPVELNNPWGQLSWWTQVRVLGPSLFWPKSWHRIC